MKQLFLFFSVTFFWAASVLFASASDLVLSLPADKTNFPIYKATPGAGVVDCYTGDNHSEEYVIQQWNNDQSLCLDSSNQPLDSDCAGADFARETATERACYWKNQKKMRLEVNGSAMRYHGCCVSCNPQSLANPGGYSAYLMDDLGQTPNYASEKLMDIYSLDKLILSTDFSTDSYNQGECASTDPVDPIFGRTQSGFSYMNLIFNMLDKTTGEYQGTIFYQTTLFDNRSSWQNGQEEYKSCGFPTSTTSKPWLVFTFSIKKFGQDMALPGQGIKHYQWDILSDLKNQISTCGYANKYNIKLSGMFIGNEMQNAVGMSNTFIDPKISLEARDTPPIGYYEPANSSCSISGWACDPDRFSQPLSVQFFDGNSLIGSTLADSIRESAVGNTCGGNTNRGFKYILPNSVRDNQIHQINAKVLNIDLQGSQTGTTFPLGLVGSNSFTCAPLPPTSTPVPSACTPCSNGQNRSRGDANCDGSVNLTDFTAWANQFLSYSKTNLPKSDYSADFNCDSKVTLADFVTWRQNFGK